MSFVWPWSSAGYSHSCVFICCQWQSLLWQRVQSTVFSTCVCTYRESLPAPLISCVSHLRVLQAPVCTRKFLSFELCWSRRPLALSRKHATCKVSVNLVILVIKQIIEQLTTESVEDVHLFQELGVQKMVLTFQVKTFFFLRKDFYTW